jgi:hypothetical protein
MNLLVLPSVEMYYIAIEYQKFYLGFTCMHPDIYVNSTLAHVCILELLKAFIIFLELMARNQVKQSVIEKYPHSRIKVQS